MLDLSADNIRRLVEKHSGVSRGLVTIDLESIVDEIINTPAQSDAAGLPATTAMPGKAPNAGDGLEALETHRSGQVHPFLFEP